MSSLDNSYRKKGPPEEHSYWLRIMQTRWALPATPARVSGYPDKALKPLTVSVVIDEPLARVELATGLSVDQELQRLAISFSDLFTYRLTTSDPSTTLPSAVVETAPNGSSLGRSSELRRAMNRSSPISGSAAVRTSQGLRHGGKLPAVI